MSLMCSLGYPDEEQSKQTTKCLLGMRLIIITNIKHLLRQALF